MQVLLTKNVEGLGRAGEIKDVAGGYAHNFLFPRKLAVPLTEAALKQAQQMKEAEARRRERRASEAKTLAEQLNGKTVVFHARAGEGERLYGSITGADIAEALSRMVGHEIERRLVDLEHPIKTLGEHAVPIKIASGVTATVYVRVERSAETA
ncbi:MAG: 50S ribosomal protein L9 [Anaerolineae bacterium]|nr:50S ribosomal protein L9 [Anaerolineae bacterium]